MIPKTILQVSKIAIADYVKELVFKACPNYNYYNWNDERDVYDFLNEYKFLEFSPNIIEVYNRFERIHGVDLLRYLYIYQFGGFYLDSDAMVYQDLTTIAEKYDMFVVGSWSDKKMIFLGAMGSMPRNPIIKEMIHFICNTTREALDKDYFYFCWNMGVILEKYLNDSSVKILYLQEYMSEGECKVSYNDEVLIRHFWYTKYVPKNENEHNELVKIANQDYEKFLKEKNIILRTSFPCVMDISEISKAKLME